MGKVAPAFHEDTNCYARKGESAGQQGAAATTSPDAPGQVNFTATGLFNGRSVLLRFFRIADRQSPQRSSKNRRRPVPCRFEERPRTARTPTSFLARNRLAGGVLQGSQLYNGSKLRRS